MREVGDAVITEVRLAGVGAASGAPVDQVFHQVYRFRQGKMVSLHSYADKAEALEAVGLSE
jgi:ketosteroid isomerase-like protein